MGLLKNLTDSVGITKKTTGVLKIPFEVDTGLQEGYEDKHYCIPVGGVVECCVWMDFTGEPFPIGTTIPVPHSVLFENDGEFDEIICPRNHGMGLQERWIDTPLVQVPIINNDRIDGGYYQTCATLKGNMKEHFEKSVDKGFGNVDEALLRFARMVLKHEDKFVHGTKSQTWID